MKIHPLWFVCIFVRLSLICLIIYFNKKNNKKINKICASILLIMGLGFIYKGLSGSNNEIQVNKVFWHETRYVHGMFYLLSSFYLFKNNVNITSLLLLSDIIFSFLFRFILKK
jgi:hypothetical protein